MWCLQGWRETDRHDRLCEVVNHSITPKCFPLPVKLLVFLPQSCVQLSPDLQYTVAAYTALLYLRCLYNIHTHELPSLPLLVRQEDSAMCLGVMASNQSAPAMPLIGCDFGSNVDQVLSCSACDKGE